ncbi:MAG: hypothetical protein GVY18_06055 [Bacteroidetes bacterium]|jgi:hypothetical protein|nr:hypothetical protein [Bacteroidota bacterium]
MRAATDRRPFPLPSSLLPYLALLLLVAVSACDAGFDPIATNEDEFFSVYGVLDTGADTQFVRVSPVRETTAAPTPPLDATVRATAEETGRGLAWQDSLVQVTDTTVGFLFFTTDAVTHGETYALAVRRSDGAETRARLTLPPSRTLSEQPPERSLLGRLEQPVVWDGLSRAPHRATVHYCVRPPTVDAPVLVSLPLDEEGESVDDGWRLTVELEIDRSFVLQRLNRPVDDSSVELHGLRMTIEERTEAWRLPDPSARIENGFGFFGGVARHEGRWTLLPSTVDELRYVVPETTLQCP